MADERRSSHRVRMSGVRVSYESVAGEVEADALDIGPGGLFVRTAAPLGVGKRISLEIQVIGEKGPWSVLGRVVWTREKGEGDQAPPGMGIKLIDADDGVVTAIEHLVETRERTEPGVGVFRSNPPPPPESRKREPTLSGVGPAESSPPPPPREQSVAIDLATRKALAPARPAPAPAAAPTTGTGRWIVVLLLVVVAAIAAYVLIDGFLRPPH
jgi:uncharacterized protein (TIGR02266 family)